MEILLITLGSIAAVVFMGFLAYLVVLGVGMSQ